MFYAVRAKFHIAVSKQSKILSRLSGRVKIRAEAVGRGRIYLSGNVTK